MDLISAIEEGDLDTVRRLLNSENVNFQDDESRTPLLVASYSGNKDIVELLLAHDDIDVNLQDREGRSPLRRAVDKRSTEILKLLLSRDDVFVRPRYFDGYQDWFEEILQDYVNAAELLVRGISVDTAGDNNLTLLLHAANSRLIENLLVLISPENRYYGGKDWISRFRMISDQNMNVMRLLISKCNIDLGYRFDGGSTLSRLIYTKEENFDILELLLEKQCEICPGRNPLSWAAEVGDEETTKLLLTRGASVPNEKDGDGRTALSRAAENGHTDVIIELLARSSTNPNIKDPDGQTPLSWAARKGFWKVIERLMTNKATDPNVRDTNGQSPLMWALESREAFGEEFQKAIELLVPKDIGTLSLLVQENKQAQVKLLCDAGSNVSERNQYGQTPLHLAVSMGYVDIARDLLSHGADTKLQDSGDLTPLQIAMRAKDHRCIRELLEYSASMAGIMADEWRDLYGKGRDDILLLSESIHGKRVDFTTSLPTGELSHASTTSNRSLYSMVEDSNHSTWRKVPIIGSMDPLAPNELQIKFPKKIDGNILDVAMSLWLSFEDFLSPNTSATPDVGIYRIAWKLKPPTNPSNAWAPMVYFSTLPNGWMPENELDLLKQFIFLVRKDWISFCAQFEKYLSDRRLQQLEYKGRNADMIDLLANDARKLAELRDMLQTQVRGVDKFIKDYCRHYCANQDSRGVLTLLQEEFERTVDNMMGKMDQTVRDFLQIEFAWTSINETRISTRLGQNVMLLTYVSIFYLPLGFCAALWAIPDITNSSTRTPFIITSVAVGLVTLLVTFNMGRIAAVTQQAIQYGKDAVTAAIPGQNGRTASIKETNDLTNGRKISIGAGLEALVTVFTRDKEQDKQESKDGYSAC